jgi:hypothetical protein
MECERSARGGEARVYRVHDLPFMVRQSVPRDGLETFSRPGTDVLHPRGTPHH